MRSELKSQEKKNCKGKRKKGKERERKRTLVMMVSDASNWHISLSLKALTVRTSGSPSWIYKSVYYFMEMYLKSYIVSWEFTWRRRIYDSVIDFNTSWSSIAWQIWQILSETTYLTLHELKKEETKMKEIDPICLNLFSLLLLSF